MMTDKKMHRFLDKIQSLAHSDKNHEIIAPKQTEKLFHCPCCRLPTLSVRGDYEICLICWWEDDGQGDTDADKIKGESNGKYSLTQARINFERHRHMYDVGDEISLLKTPDSFRKQLMKLVEAAEPAGQNFDTKKFLTWKTNYNREKQ